MPFVVAPGGPRGFWLRNESWAAEIGGPAYAIDDQTAIQVVDGEVRVVSEGHWRRFGG